MYIIDYLIADELEIVRKMNSEEFDYKRGGIAGYVRITYGDCKIGYIPAEGEQDDIGGEWVDIWIWHTLRAAVSLCNNGYSAFSFPEYYKLWLEYRDTKEGVLINKMEETTKYPNFPVTMPMELSAPSTTQTFLRANQVSCEKKQQVISETIDKAKCFLEEIGQVSTRLLQSEMALKVSQELDLLTKKTQEE